MASSCNRELKEHPISAKVKQEMAAREKANDPRRSISGTIKFGKSIASKIKEIGTLFLIARPKGVSNGPPLAAKRHSLIKFPFEFKIGQENVMIEGNTFEGSITITARWDLDGLPKASPGDLSGTITVPVGSRDVNIMIDYEIKADKELVKPNTIAGTIFIDPKLENKIPEGAFLFLIARSEGAQRGIPLAVKKLKKIKFPYAFILGQKDVMLPGALFEGPLTIFARLDKDGDAAPAVGDIDGSSFANAGDQQVEIMLNNLIGS